MPAIFIVASAILATLTVHANSSIRVNIGNATNQNQHEPEEVMPKLSVKKDGDLALEAFKNAPRPPKKKEENNSF